MLDKTIDLNKIKHVAPGFDQLILFTISKEELNKQNRWASSTVNRKVRICYVGWVDSLYKYQLGCIESDYKLVYKADASADLFTKLHRIFTLLVIGADEQGTIKKIYNFPYLQQEWLEIKKDLLLEYDDTDIEKWALICKMDVLMQDYTEVVHYLQLPSMYGLFFNGYWVQCLPEQPLIIAVTYDEVMHAESFEECIEYSMQETASQQQVKIDIKGNPLNEKIQSIFYTGTCIFLDGALDKCHKKIDAGSTKFNYSARWVGLKKLFQL